jgi:hypothetical protein
MSESWLLGRRDVGCEVKVAPRNLRRGATSPQGKCAKEGRSRSVLHAEFALLHSRRRESDKRGSLRFCTAKWRDLSECTHMFKKERDSFGKKTGVETIGTAATHEDD